MNGPAQQTRLELLLLPLLQEEQRARQELERVRQEERSLESDLLRCRLAMASHDAFLRRAEEAGDAVDLAFYRQCAAELAGQQARVEADLAAARQRLRPRREELARCLKRRQAHEKLLARVASRAAADAARRDVREQDQAHAGHAFWRREELADAGN